FDRSRAAWPSTHTSPASLDTAGRTRWRQNAARSIRPPWTSARARPAGSGTHTDPRQRLSGFATQPVAAAASRAGHQSVVVEACAPVTPSSPESVSTLTMAWLLDRDLTIGTARAP